MAIFGQISREELGTKYTNYGWFCGLCPVYIGGVWTEAPTIAERNWIPGWWLSFVTWLYGCFIFACSVVSPDYEPMWPITISGEIK